MQTFTGWQYLLIDVANQFDLDKLLFEERIQWATDNLANLEALIEQCPAKTRPLYVKAVLAIRKAQKSLPTGHLVGLDACCSGIQVMSALTGCTIGANSTGMIDLNRRADAYGDTKKYMGEILEGTVDVNRSDAKQAVMTSFYGSKKTPKDIFGEDTPELTAFYEAISTKVAPGAWELLQDLLGSWQPYALSHSWKLPDGFDARVKVMKKVEARIEVDELDHATFTYEFYENEGTKSGLSNVANVTHSMDAWILRSMHRRCNYDKGAVEAAQLAIHNELEDRGVGLQRDLKANNKVAYYIDQYERSTLADAVILPYINPNTVGALSDDHLEKLLKMTKGMLQHPPFELVTVHDEFKAHPNNLNQVRFQYKEIMAEIAESNVLDDIASQIHGEPVTFNKLSFNLADQIRNSNYALC